MEIMVKRIYFHDSCTIGALQVNGCYMMDTLEPHAIDWQRENKTAGMTAIPEGRYRIGIDFSKTFKRRMPYLINVPCFKSVMIHTGKTEKNTRGDILVGKVLHATTLQLNNGGKCFLENSRANFKQLFTLIENAINMGEDVWVTIRSPNNWNIPQRRNVPQ